MDKKLMLIADLVDCINSAIKAGDWKVDGACDPDSILKRARLMIEKNESGENIILTKDNIEIKDKQGSSDSKTMLYETDAAFAIGLLRLLRNNPYPSSNPEWAGIEAWASDILRRLNVKYR